MAGFTLYVYTLLTAHYYVRLTAKKKTVAWAASLCARGFVFQC